MLVISDPVDGYGVSGIMLGSEDRCGKGKSEDSRCKPILQMSGVRDIIPSDWPRIIGTTDSIRHDAGHE